MSLTTYTRRHLETALANRRAAKELADVIDHAVANTTGNVFYVDSGAGSDSAGAGGTKDSPFATLDFAVGRCTANNGDIIFLMPGHAETIVADSGVDIDVAGITVIGMGEGAARPTFTFTTAVTADFKLAANNTTVFNCLFVAGIDALTGPIEISGDDCALLNCEYRDDDTGNFETTDVIVTASTPLRMVIDGFKFIHDGGSGGTQNQSVIQLNGADKAVIRNCWLVADSGTGVIEDATTSDQILIDNCIVESTNASPVVAIFLSGTTTGTIRNSSLRVASGTTYLTAVNDMQFFETFGTGTDATTGEKVGTILSGDIEGKLDVIDGFHDVPTADVATNAQMRDVVGNKTDAAVTTVAADKSVLAYIKGILNVVAAANVALNPRLGIKVTKAAGDFLDGVQNALFTVSGGRVLITQLSGEVSGAAVDAGANATNFISNPTVGTDMNLCGTLDITGDELGTLYGITGVITDAMTGGSGGGASAMDRGIIVPEGTVDVKSAVDGGTGGALLSAELWYFPLDTGASVAST